MKKPITILTFILLILSCKKDNKLPIANAGSDQSIKEGAIVTLDGSASTDPDGDALTYKWTAPSGITLSSTTDAQPTFTAPDVSTETTYTFTLIVNDGQADSPDDQVVIANANEDKFLPFITAGQTDGPGIKYVDIDPDETLYGSEIPLNLDLNNDGIDDFTLIYFDRNIMPSTYVNYLTITPLGENSVCVSKTMAHWVESLTYKDTIGNNNNWSNLEAKLYSYRSYVYSTPEGTKIDEGISGYWYDQDNIYMGVKIVKDGKQIFGWVDIKKSGKGKYPKVAIRQYAVTIPY